MEPKKLKLYLPTKDEFIAVTSDTRFSQRFRQHVIENSLAVEASSPAEADVVVVFEEWSFKLPSYGDTLSSSNFFKEFARKIYVVNYDSIVGEGFLPGCYVSLQKSLFDPARFKPCVYPKEYNEHIDQTRASSVTPTKLFSFRGTGHSHNLRKQIFDLFKDKKCADIVDVTKEFHTHTDSDKLEYVQQMYQSIFILCPRGWSPNSYRLYETMSVGRCPVIISDEWVENPGPDWASCSIRVAEKDIARIPEILHEHRSQGLEMGTRALNEWNNHFAESAKYKQYFNAISELYHSQHSVTKSLTEYRKHWRSAAFRRRNSWTLPQKLQRKLLQLFSALKAY